MDAAITKTTFGLIYKLVNRVNGKIEFETASRIQAQNERNMLWTRGIKTDLIEPEA